MPDSTSKDDDTVSPPQSSVLLTLIATVADTTWRLFLPTIGGTIGGIIVDRSLDTRPWFTTIGVIGGTIIASALVYFQIKRVQTK